MRQILFIHSAGPQSTSEGSGQFLARLRPLLDKDEELSAPLMPNPESPEAHPWVEAVGRHIAHMREPFAMVGHSLGGSIILKYLAERGIPAHLVGVVTVAAPFWGAPGWNVPEFVMPANAGAQLAAVPITLLLGRQDETVPPDHLDRYRSAIPTATTALIEGDHEFGRGDIAAVADAIHALPFTTVRRRPWES